MHKPAETPYGVALPRSTPKSAVISRAPERPAFPASLAAVAVAVVAAAAIVRPPWMTAVAEHRGVTVNCAQDVDISKKLLSSPKTIIVRSNKPGQNRTYPV